MLIEAERVVIDLMRRSAQDRILLHDDFHVEVENDDVDLNRLTISGGLQNGSVRYSCDDIWSILRVFLVGALLESDCSRTGVQFLVHFDLNDKGTVKG